MVQHLQKPGYTIIDFLGETAGLKQKLATSGIPVERLIHRWQQLDQTVADCLALTSAPHEKFIEDTLHAFCEFEQDGTITFANAKMLEFAPNCVGQPLAAQFGKMAGEVSKLSKTTGLRRLHDLELE